MSTTTEKPIETKHTPTPWMVNKIGGITGDHEAIVINDLAHCAQAEQKPMNNGFGRAKANAEFIVRAVNKYDRVHQALSALLALHDDQVFICGQDDEKKVADALRAARAALNP